MNRVCDNRLIARLCAAFVFMTALTATVNAAEDKEISVFQFNIWQEGTVVDGGFDAIADEIARLKPDFVTLSEPRNYHNTRFCDRLVDALANRGEKYYSFYSYDSGLLSRHEITDSATIYPIQGDHGTVYKLRTNVHGLPVAVYTGHLDYQNDTYYEVRGYDGNTWKRMAAPLTDVDTIIYRNNLSLRDDEIKAFIADALTEVAAGSVVLFGGDFNEPSGLDWTESTRDSADHHGVVVDWPCTAMLRDAGFMDAYRIVHPDPLTHPGYTYPSDNPLVPVSKLAWAPEADERDRIDYVFYYPRSDMHPVEASIVGPRGSIKRGERYVERTSDEFIEPLGVWPTDHKGVLVKFVLRR